MSSQENYRLLELERWMQSFPDSMVEELKTETPPFICSETVLIILDESCGESPEEFSREVLQKLHHTTTIKTLVFYPLDNAGELYGPVFDFANFSKPVAKTLPNLEEIYIEEIRAKNFKIELKSVKKLHLTRINRSYEERNKWALKLPNLRELYMVDHTPPDAKLGRAFINSPLIEVFYSHKGWLSTKGNTPFYLPNCKNFCIRRVEIACKLQLYLPRVEKVDLSANWPLESLVFLEEGHEKHAEWNHDQGTPQSRFKLCAQNAIFSKSVKKELRGNQRVMNRGKVAKQLIPDN